MLTIIFQRFCTLLICHHYQVLANHLYHPDKIAERGEVDEFPPLTFHGKSRKVIIFKLLLTITLTHLSCLAHDGWCLIDLQKN